MAQANNRKLRQLVRGVLDKHGIPDEVAAVVEFEMSAVVTQHFASRQKELTKVREKNLDILEMIGAAAGKAGEITAVQTEFENEFKRSPNWTSREWDALTKFLIERKKEGQTVAKFAEWFNSDDFRRKQGIFLSPERIRDWWTQAFARKTSSKFDGV